jgi:hypothetical protein
VSILLRDDLEKQPSGVLSYRVFRNGELIEEVEDNNLIVVGSQVTHARLLGGDVTNRSITQIGFGTNGTAAAFANASLTGAYTNNVAAPTYPATNQVSFGFSLGTTEANGIAILEFGLLTAGGILYARKVRSTALNKASDITLSGTWVISF